MRFKRSTGSEGDRVHRPGHPYLAESGAVPLRAALSLAESGKLCCAVTTEWPQTFNAVEQRYAGVEGGFCLLANVKRIAVDEPFEITPGIRVRPAWDDEASVLSELLANLIPANLFYRYRNPYETRLEHEFIEPGHTQMHIHDLPAGEHRYCVAEFTGIDTISRVLELSALTIGEIEEGITIRFGSHPGISWYPVGRQQPILEEASKDDDILITLERSHLEDLRSVIAQFKKHDDKEVRLLPALAQFSELHAIPKFSPLRFLGYVAILESLITHQPNPTDPYDSLTKQVTNKMILLGRRCRLKLPYEYFGTNCNPETLWKKLYAYRSKVAHGSSVDFKGKFQMLGSAEQALSFIRDSTAAIMRHALDEPELIVDLRAC